MDGPIDNGRLMEEIEEIENNATPVNSRKAVSSSAETPDVSTHQPSTLESVYYLNFRLTIKDPFS